MKRRGAASFLSQGVKSAGYTLTEVMIVMAVSGALFIAVAIMLNGRQAQTEFNQALRDYESKIQSTANDVSSGYYQTGNYNCTPGAGVGQVNFNTTPPIKAAGTNYGCVFLGKMITTGATSSDVFTVMGRQFKSTPASGDVENLADAKPRAVYQLPLDITENYTHRFGIQIRRVYIIGTTTPVGGFGFISELGGGAGLGDPVTGSRGVLLYRLDATVTPNPKIRSDNSADIGAMSDALRTDQGIKICFWDGGGRRGEITVGANGSQTSTFVTVDNGVSSECRA